MRPSAPDAGSEGRARQRADGGFTLVELLMAMSVFSIVIVGFSLLFASSLKSFSSSRAQTAASQLAGTELEKARNVGWDNLGTVAGNPPGTLIAGPETVTVGTMTFTVTRRVELIDDPVPQGFTTGANYKRVIIKVSSRIMATPLQTETIVAPPIQPSLYTGVVKITVVSVVQPDELPNAVVSMTGGPSSNRSDTTDSDGRATFAGLTPHSNNTDVYTFTSTLAGWKPDLTAATDGRINLAPGDVTDRVLKMYKPGTITVSVVDAGKKPVGTPITVSVTGPDEAGVTRTDTRSYTAADGKLTLSTFNGGSIIPGQTYTFMASSVGYSLATPMAVALTPDNYPTNVDAPVTIELPIPARVDTTLSFVDQATGQPLVVSGTLAGTPTAGPDDPGPFTTDAAGVAVFRLLPRTAPAKYLLTVNLPGYYPLSSPMTVDGSTPTITLTIALQPLPPPMPVAFTVTGGTPAVPIAGATVTVSGGPSGTVTFVTDPAGTGTINLVAGSYTVTVNQPGYTAYTAPLTVTTTTPPASVVLGAKGAVTFQARNGTTAAAVGPATLTLTGGTGTSTVAIDSAGAGFAYLEPGTYTVVSATYPTTVAPYSGPLTVVAGPQTATITFSTLGVVTFTTTDASTSAVVGTVTVTLKDSGGTTTTLVTNASGTASPVNLAPGTYTYTATVASGYAPNKGTVTIAPGVQTTNVPLTAGVSVNIRTRTSSNSRVGPVTLLIRNGPGADQQITTSTPSGGSGGNFNTMMVPGTYEVVGITFPSGFSAVASGSATITITSGGNTTVTVQ